MSTAGNTSPYRLENVRAAIGHFLLGRGAGAIAGLATAVLLVRYMDTTAYATYTAFMGIVGIAGMVASLGLDRVATRFIPEGVLYQGTRELKGFVWKLIFTRLFIATVMVLLMGATWDWVLSFFDFATSKQLSLALVIFLLVNTLFNLSTTILQALVRQKLLTQVTVLVWSGRLVWILLVITQQSHLSLEQALWIMALPEAAGSAILMSAVHMSLRSSATKRQQEEENPATWPCWGEIRSLARHTYAFEMLASLPQGYFMRTLVAATLPVETVAAYGFFSSLIDRLRMYLPMQLMYNLVEPVLVARYLQDKDERALTRNIWLIYKANLLIVVMALVFLFIGGQPVVSLLTGGKYVEQTWILSLLFVQIALGSHVLAMQLVVDVLKQNRILSLSGAGALAVMLVFLGIAFFSEQQLWVLFGALIYSVAMNAMALVLLARSKVVYRPQLKEVAKLVSIGLSLAFLSNMISLAMDAASLRMMTILIGGMAALLLALITLKWRYADEREIGMLKKLFRAKRAT